MNLCPSSSPVPSFQGVKKGRVPGLDGWRAVSILLVIFSHCHWATGHPAWMDHHAVPSIGKLGVRCFFVISGFLITLLMLREGAKTGTVNPRSFYIRRSLRIFPAYFVFLAVILILQAVTALEIPFGDWLACLTFTRNFFGYGPTTAHLWSLGIEQQFYLIWPLAFIFLKPHRSPQAGLLFLSLPILLCPVFRVTGALLGGAPVFSDCSFFLQADALAIGCVTAITLWHFGDPVADLSLLHRAWLAPAGILLMLLPPLLPWETRFWWLVGCASVQAQAWGFAILLVLAIQERRWRIFGVLDSLPMVFLGGISYSLYIWQQIFWLNPPVLGGDSTWWNSYPGWMATAFVAALVSYYLVERPFLQMKGSSARRENLVKPQLANEAATDFPRS